MIPSAYIKMVASLYAIIFSLAPTGLCNIGILLDTITFSTLNFKF